MQPSSLPGMHAGQAGGPGDSAKEEILFSLRWQEAGNLFCRVNVSYQPPTHEDVAKPRVEVARVLQVVDSWDASIFILYPRRSSVVWVLKAFCRQCEPHPHINTLAS